MLKKVCRKLILPLLFLVAVSATPKDTEDTENLLFDFDEVFGVNHNVEQLDGQPIIIDTSKFGFPLCEECALPVRSRELEESTRKFGHPVCHRCMAEIQIKDEGINDPVEQEKIRQEYIDKYYLELDKI